MKVQKDSGRLGSKGQVILDLTPRKALKFLIKFPK